MKHYLDPSPTDCGGKMNEYHILEKMAAGSFGVIFKVRRVTDNAVLVMKRIALADLGVEQRREAAQEIRVMSRLHHTFIVAQRDAFLFNDSLCIVMDYYDGGDLAALITRQREKNEYLPMEQVLAWFAEINLGMHYLHDQGIVHRDLKTHNLFLNSNTGEVAVGDFGVAEFVSAAGGSKRGSPFATPLAPASQHLFAQRCDSELFGDCGSDNGDLINGPFGGAVRGTLLYMAPEVLESGVCSPSSDVWALGCILYELLSLRHPFESRDIATLMMRVMAGTRSPPPGHYPAEVVRLLDSMLSLDAAQRPSCEEILRTPVMSAPLQKIVEQMASRKSQDREAARTWAAQMQRLGICNQTVATSPCLPYLWEPRPTLSSPQERVLVKTTVPASPRPELPSSPRNSSFGDGPCSTWMPPLPLRVDHEGNGVHSRDGDASPYRERKKDCDDADDVSSYLSWKLGDGNVEDMRHVPIELVEAEVARYRQLVQSEMRKQKLQRDAALHKSRFGRDTPPKKYYYNSLARVGRLTAPSIGAHHTLQTVMNSSPPPSSLPSPSPIHLHRLEQAKTASVSATASRWPQGSLEASLEVRRQKRMGVAVGVLGHAVFSSVYAYYRGVEVAEREVASVMQLVPDRAKWHVLPVIEEVVVIDRLLERMEANGP
ncbi:serine/threonine protein kinase [Trypanosoma rangeli SC58]|uniref:non-specific serine/threonine protein kinase n=1 Tax=Trypanosoma rangeli SC58 TaxID=429131 RepID=A0A061IXQ0_TRYRA|nr:serine/threonine protein kinase [Trypanosoma rangeli SC58]